MGMGGGVQWIRRGWEGCSQAREGAGVGRGTGQEGFWLGMTGGGGEALAGKLSGKGRFRS